MKMITQLQLNEMLQETIQEVERAGIEVGNINPSVKINSATTFYGICKKRGDVYNIEISKYYLMNPMEQVKQTLVHEVLHTVKGCYNHGKTWKKWADLINKAYGYSISRTSKHGFHHPEYKEVRRKYKIECTGCGNVWHRQKRSKLVTHAHTYTCGKCKSKLQLVTD